METTCGFKSHLPHRAKKSQTKWSGSFFDRSGSGLEPRFKVSAPLRSAQSRGPPDLVRPIFRRLCLPARSVRSMWSTGPHSPHLPLAGADLNPGSRSPLRSGPRKAEVHRTSCAPSSADYACRLGRFVACGPPDHTHPIFRLRERT